MTASTTYLRRPELHAVEMDGELVMMGLKQGEYYSLRDVAASLWQHLGEPHTLDELCELVAGEYDVSVQDCRDDVSAFLQDLTAKSMVDERG
jgi:DNA-directed RNA polymerase delta subunit